MTSVVCHQPADPMYTHGGWRRAPPPRPPHGEMAALRQLRPRRVCDRRRVACPARITRRDHQRRAHPDFSGSARSATARQPAPQVLHFVSAFQVTARDRPCEHALAGQLKSWPAFHDDQAQRMRRLLSPRTGARDRIGHHRPRAEHAAVEQRAATADGKTAAGAQGSRSPTSTSRTTATRPARWRRKTTRTGRSR